MAVCIVRSIANALPAYAVLKAFGFLRYRRGSVTVRPMSHENLNPSEGGEGESTSPKFRARVPESVARGVFATGALVIGGPHEYVIDFVVRLTRPYQVVARVVMPPAVMGQLVQTLADNIEKFRDRFGDPPPPPEQPPSQVISTAGSVNPPPQNIVAGGGEAASGQGRSGGDSNAAGMSVRDIYDELKVSDDILTGSYANAVMIGHGPSEFCLDFITSFMPTAAVTERVYLAAPQVIRLLDSIRETYRNHERKAGRRPADDDGADPPESQDPPDSE